MSGFFVARRDAKDNEMQNQDAHRAAALKAVGICFQTRFATANYLFAAGSIMRGQGTHFSDIDLVVVFPSLERAWRESFTVDGFPVEAFVHDHETIAYYMAKDIEAGRPVMLSMVATGTIFGPDIEAARELKAVAERLIAEGPRQLVGPAYDTMRYLISDLADDLRGDRSPDEVAGIAAVLYPKLVDLILLGRGQWTGSGKWGARLVKSCDADLAGALARAFRAAAIGDGRALLKLTDAELARHGGRYFEGYKVLAPIDARE